MNVSFMKRLKVLEEKSIPKEPDYLFLSFVSMDMSQVLHSVQEIGTSLHRQNTEKLPTDEFLKLVSAEWDVDVFSMFYKDNEVVEIK